MIVLRNPECPWEITADRLVFVGQETEVIQNRAQLQRTFAGFRFEDMKVREDRVCPTGLE